MKRHVKSMLLQNAVAPVEPLEADADVLMQLMLRSLDCGTWRFDMASYSSHWSPAACRLHGIDPDEDTVSFERSVRLYHPDDAKLVANIIKDAIVGRHGFSYTARVMVPDGTVRLIEAVAAPEMSETGSITALVGTFRDVTKRHKATDAADSRGAMLTTIIEHSPAPMAMLDRNLKYLCVSRTWYTFHGLQPEKSILGKSHYVIFPNTPAQWRTEHQRALLGQIIQRGRRLESRLGWKMRAGSVVLPWRTPSGAIGGIILMRVLAGANEAMAAA